jgi:hypothetical protein
MSHSNKPSKSSFEKPARAATFETPIPARLLTLTFLPLLSTTIVQAWTFHQFRDFQGMANTIRTIPNDYSNYKPINSANQEIRVLVLHPAKNREDPIICSLVRSSLISDAPCYEAISYCWGNLDDTSVIRVHHLEDRIRLRGKELCDIDTGEECLHSPIIWEDCESPSTEWEDCDPTEEYFKHQERYVRY